MHYYILFWKRFWSESFARLEELLQALQSENHYGNQCTCAGPCDHPRV
jgi:hypothetical protein